jgi:hypothetical protein
MDDVIAGSTSFETHFDDLKALFKRLTEFGLTVKLSKCKFFKRKLVYLGHEIDNGGIRPNPAKISAVEKIKPPHNLRGLRHFLGLTSYYRRFIKGYADLAAPLNALMQKDVMYHWMNVRRHSRH